MSVISDKFLLTATGIRSMSSLFNQYYQWPGFEPRQVLSLLLLVFKASRGVQHDLHPKFKVHNELDLYQLTSLQPGLAQSAWAAEYTDCISAKE